MLQNNSFYGGFDTATFSEIWPNIETWMTDYNRFKESIQLISIKNERTIQTVYYLLSSEYAFSHHIGSRDQFRLMMFARVLEYAPYYERELEIQTDLMQMNIESLQQGSKAIYNQALNPGSVPSSQALDELQYINQQNVTNYKKSRPEAYAILLSLMNKNLSKDFVEKFRNLFIKVCYPNYPLYYANDPEAVYTEGE